MRRIFLIALLGSCFGAYIYFGIAPQHTFAAHYSTEKTTVIVTALTKQSKQNKQSEQQASGFPWPSLKFPDISFLWKQQGNSQKKDMYDRGQ